MFLTAVKRKGESPLCAPLMEEEIDTNSHLSNALKTWFFDPKIPPLSMYLKYTNGPTESSYLLELHT